MKQLDVVVIGGSVGGLFATTLLVTAGKNVLIIESKKKVGGKFYNEDVKLSKSTHKILNQVHLQSSKNTKELVDQLERLIENNHGEIVYDTKVTAIEYQKKLWHVTSSYGSLDTPCLVLGISAKDAARLLKDSSNSEELYKISATTSFLLPPNAKKFGLFLVTNDPQAKSGRQLLSSLKSAKSIAEDVLKM